LAAKFSGDQEILIEVADSGPGIPPENLRRIFDYYFTTKDKGMGLGLPLAHKIIKEHGGRIEVISKVGQGTIFQVFLPRQEED
jgi:signal transduction histidine kinase